MTNMNNKSKSVICMIAILIMTGCGQNYSTGTRVGVVTKLSKKGIVWDSWEGELLMALPSEVGGSVQPEKFSFSIGGNDTVVVSMVQAAMKSGKRVELVYRQWLCAPPTIDTQYVIIDVK